MCELEPELRGGAEAGEEDVFEVDVGRFEGAVVEQRREAVGEHVARSTCETEIDSKFLSKSKSTQPSLRADATFTPYLYCSVKHFNHWG